MRRALLAAVAAWFWAGAGYGAELRTAAIVPIVASDSGVRLIGAQSAWSAADGLQTLPAGFVARDVTPDGGMVVGSLGSLAATWRPGEAAKTFPGKARGVSADGRFVVGDVSSRAVRWDDSGAYFVPRVGTEFPWEWSVNPHAAVGVSDDGRAMTGYARLESYPGGELLQKWAPFLWTEAGGTKVLDSPWPDATDVKPVAISADGSTVLAERIGPVHTSYLWTAAGMTILGDYNPKAMTADAKTVLLSSPGGSYVWREATGVIPVESFLGVDTAGWTKPLWADDISRDGTAIVGHALRDGVNTGWLGLVEPTTLGDLDQDADVDIFDVTALQPHFGKISGAVWAEGDLDHNWAVDIFDVTLLQPNYGAGMPGSAPQAVPEPSTLILCLVGLLALLSTSRFVKRG